MHKISTLLFRINSFQADCDHCNVTEPENVIDTVKTTTEGPSERSIKNILDFARSYDVLETESTGYVEMILN
jgi:hypothetical protein